MRLSTASLCLSASSLVSASGRIESTISETQLANEESALASSSDQQNNLEVQPDATSTITQATAVRTLWMQSQIGLSATYVEVVYTQTFTSVVDQWSLPGKRETGYGTLQRNKRDAEPTTIADASATAFVLELQTLIHTVAVTPVLQVTELTEITVDINGNTSNASLPGELSPATPWASGT